MALVAFIPANLAGVGLQLVNSRLTTLNALGFPDVTGVPTLGDLIPGFAVTQTTFNSAYDWPLLGLGPLLGLSGSTSISNTYAQLPSLTGSDLRSAILAVITLTPNTNLTRGIVNLILAPLNLINTPSVTAWIPAGQGNYGLPLGGSIGWLATMPTLNVGPVLNLSTTDTVVATPIFAGGAVLPLGLASFGYVGTPGVVFPTATGVSTLGGTSLTSFAIPGLGLSMTNLNILSSIYVGTNGINWNSGTSVLILTTPFGALPIVYSLGSFNIGATGFGFTLPSLFTIGLLPPFQVGTAPTQQSPDGLIPANVLNLGLGIPTQTNDLITLLGLPNPGDAVEAILNPLFNTFVAPIGALVTNGLNGLVGPLANGIASGIEQLTALLAQLTGGGPPFNSTATATTFAASTMQDMTLTDGGPQTNLKSSLPQVITQSATDTDVKTTTNNGVQTSASTNGATTPTQKPAPPSAPTDPADKPGPRLNVVTQTGNPATDLNKDGTKGASTGDNDARKQLTTTVKKLTDRVKGTVTDVTDQAGDGSSEESGDATGSLSSTTASVGAGTS